MDLCVDGYTREPLAATGTGSPWTWNQAVLSSPALVLRTKPWSSKRADSLLTTVNLMASAMTHSYLPCSGCLIKLVIF